MLSNTHITDNQENLFSVQLALLIAINDELLTKEKIKKSKPIVSDALMLVFIIATLVSWIDKTNLLKSSLELSIVLYCLTYAGWDVVDLLSIKPILKDMDSENEKTRQAAKITMGSNILMSMVAIWTIITTAISQQTFTKATLTGIGAGCATAASAFSFSLAMFAAAFNSYVGYKHAVDRSSIEGLLRHKNEKLDYLIKKQTLLEEKLSKYDTCSEEEEPTEETLLISEKTDDPKKIDLQTEYNNIKQQIASLNTEINHITITKDLNTQEKISDQKTIDAILKTDLMLAEQRNIAAVKKLDTLMYTLAGVGSLLMATAMIPGVNFGTVPIGLICYTVAIGISVYQLYNKYLSEPLIDHTSRNEREQIFLDKNRNLPESYTQIKENLFKGYCLRNCISQIYEFKDEQKNQAILLECKHQYAQKSSLDRLSGRIERTKLSAYQSLVKFWSNKNDTTSDRTLSNASRVIC